MKAKLALAAILSASVAHAAPKPIEVYSIWYASDTTDKTDVETFGGCLMTSSTFGTWGQLWNVGPITMHPAIVLASAAPSPLQVGTSLETEINKAITASLVPAPTANNNTVYVVHGPAIVTNNASDGSHLCYNNKSCGEHGPGLYSGKYYQAALVPLDCPLCGGTLKTATWIGMHEIAEAVADEGTASFEVGDQCEAHKNLTQLQCCGKSYTIQQFDTPPGPGACQTITATGAACTCGVVQSACTADAGTCCTGTVCQPWVAKIGDTPSDVCCFETAQTCSGTNDCCGGLTCSGGKCVCEALDQFCLRDVDCCNGHCNTTTQKCATPSPPDAGSDASADAGSDATADGGTEPPPESGCSCRAATHGGNGWPLALFAIAFGIARRVRTFPRRCAR
jgi:MYXO-CTERM domain-containing protein